MSVQELRDLWDEVTERDRPAVLREHRDAFNEHLSTEDPVPAGSIHDVRAWMDRYKGTVTRQLSEETADTDENTTTDADEAGTDE